MNARMNIRRSPLNTAPATRGRLAAAASMAAALAAALVAVPAHAKVAPVGEVSLVVGQARALASDGTVRKLEVGSTVRIGDRIETQAGGHVHLQFVDGGRVSVRPASRLVIEDYSQSGKGPQGGAIRFKLEEGVVRSITGQWGEAAKDRFRLNTPIAAIGVKGTDFAVRSDGDKTAASVYTGAIVVAKLDGACESTVGPCANGTERLLTAGMKGQMLELGRSQSAPQLVPAADLLASGMRTVLGVAAAAPAEGRASRGEGNPALPEARPAAVGEVLATDAAQQAAKAPVVNQLAWARLGPALPGDDLSQTFAQALSEGRRVTIGNFAYTLVSSAPPLSAGALIAGGEASAQMRLAGGSATLLDASGRAIEAATVGSGVLNLDFARLQFSTQLNLSSPTLGSDTLTARGPINSAGYFFSNSDTQVVAGAITPDGKEAGYLFDKKVAPGLIKGITLWGR